MKTLGVLAIIWMLYSMYRVMSKPYYHHSDATILGACFGVIGIIVGILYLIITYLP